MPQFFVGCLIDFIQQEKDFSALLCNLKYEWENEVFDPEFKQSDPTMVSVKNLVNEEKTGSVKNEDRTDKPLMI